MSAFYYPNACSKYGASMGRRSTLRLESFIGKVRLQRVPLDSGGYDPGGAYWGGGAPLWRVEDPLGEEAYFRAADRETAKKLLPNARFYR